MADGKILFADNDPDFLETRAEFLGDEGYEVISTTSLGEARKLLAQGVPDLAVLDIRMVDDDDEKDISGLILAQQVAPSVPKIILTGFPTVEAVRKALKPQKGGLPPAVDFVAKRDGPEALIAAVNRSFAVHVQKSPKQVTLSLSELLEKDYEEARRQAIFIHRARLGLIVAGGIVIIGGVIAVLFGEATAGALSAAAGVLVEVLAALFSKWSEDANKRMDRYHVELLGLYVESTQ